MEESIDTRALKRKILKNVIIISIGFFLLFASVAAMSGLQSSVNRNMGTHSLMVIYIALVLSCLFFSTWLIKKATVKWAMTGCMLGYSFYIAAQFHPTYYTLLPSAAIMGLCAAPMWSAKCTYLTEVGTLYSELDKQKSEVIISRFFGIFFLFFQSSLAASSLTSATVLARNPPPPKTEEELQYCGVNFCPGVDLGNTTLIHPPDTADVYLMSGIFLGLSVVSVLVTAIFLDPLSCFIDENAKTRSTSNKSTFQLLIANLRHMGNPYQLLIIPITIWSGIEQGYIGADFTAGYIACGIGIYMIGYVLTVDNFLDAIFSMGFTPLVKLVGRVPVFTLAALLNATAILIMFFWRPSPDETAMYFLVPALWGIADAVWQTQINALVGTIFPGESEVAFSNYRLWESIGFIISFYTQTAFCNETKLYILVASFVTGMIGYYTIELLEKYQVLPKDKDGKVLHITNLRKIED